MRSEVKTIARLADNNMTEALRRVRPEVQA